MGNNSPKTMQDYRDILGEEIESLRNKKISPVRMKAVVYAVNQYIKSIKAELEYQKLMGTKKEMSQFQ